MEAFSFLLVNKLQLTLNLQDEKMTVVITWSGPMEKYQFSFFDSFLAKMNKLQKRGPTCKQGQNKLSLGG